MSFCDKNRNLLKSKRFQIHFLFHLIISQSLRSNQFYPDFSNFQLKLLPSP
ncbi:hypothetical protein HOLDEFILI_00393 [Holdemania filiformis DSM 12042]|uniref:Uncharacterized protein n=1 Tax=Holdemania filiformis DSM 12042 TaxID=545696 RepID=B9Y3L8_9FIRM|nr:hypothetical protein HOLDEFILI_00393 [Holdemania filiformis DSM 12042]